MTRSTKLQARKLDWTTIVGISAVHLLCVLAPFYFSWGAFWTSVGLYIITIWLGIGLCYHRLLTHKSYETYRWFKYILTSIATLTWQGGPIRWVGNHRLHHKHSDQEDDPHSPTHGFCWAHVFWLFWKEPEGEDPMLVTKDLQRDKGMVIIDRYFWISQFPATITLFMIGFFIGGIPLSITYVVWGISVRTVVSYHFTWFVNSAAHTWGYRNFETTDRSTSNWWVAIFSFGEGWHNNHHAEQRCAAHGRRWWELDLIYITIRVLELCGLAWKVIKP